MDDLKIKNNEKKKIKRRKRRQTTTHNNPKNDKTGHLGLLRIKEMNHLLKSFHYCCATIYGGFDGHSGKEQSNHDQPIV